MIQPCLDLALGRAFTPDPQDAFVSLARRFAKKPLVAVTMYKDGIEALMVTFAAGQPVFGPAEFRTTSGEDSDANFLRGFAARHKAKDCIINLTTGYTAALSSRTRRAENAEEALLLMRDNPERMLGEPPAQNCRHSIAFHPTHSFAVVFAHKDNDINLGVSLASRAGLGLARLQCGMASLVMYVLEHYWKDFLPEAELLCVDRSSLFYLAAAETSFGRPLFDVGLKEAALKQAIAERVGKLRPGGRLILIDSSGLDVAAMIRERGGINVVSPLTDQPQPQILACCTDEPNLGYELFPGEREVRPFAAARLRVVPIIFWASAAAAIAVFAVNFVRQTEATSESARLTGQVTMIAATKTKRQSVIDDIRAKEKTAQAMCDWLLISPPTQPLLVRVSGEIETATKEAIRDNRSLAQLDSLSLTLQEGQPQMRIVVVLTGDASAANRVFARVSAMFSRLGFSTVDLKQTLVPQGFRYEHLVNLPKAMGT